jgi:non-heme chloroperoxidase
VKQSSRLLNEPDKEADHEPRDRILPPDATSRRQVKMIENVKYVEIKGGSHGMTWTRAEEINPELVRFLA